MSLRPLSVLVLVLAALIVLGLAGTVPSRAGDPPMTMVDVPPATAVLVVHGGAGPPKRASMTPDRETHYRDDLIQALKTGHAILRAGGSSLDAVEAAVVVLEDSPRFNAGKGAVFTHQGTHELDASIMVGTDRRAGAVAGVATIQNPIRAARAVMEKTPHVLLVGNGAETFAETIGLPMVPNDYFSTPERREALEKAIAEEKAQSGQARTRWKSPGGKPYLGTVGAVAVDRAGHLAAATSTGGMTNKRFGRVGDSPIIGAGTFADNATCAVSSTGHGEFFIRYVVAHEIAALMEHRGLSVREAAERVVFQTLRPERGEGGVIAIDAKGNYAMPFNSEGMFRGCITEDGRIYVAVYRD